MRLKLTLLIVCSCFMSCSQGLRVSGVFGLGLFPNFETASFKYDFNPSPSFRVGLARDFEFGGRQGLSIGGYLGFQNVGYQLTKKRDGASSELSTNLYDLGISASTGFDLYERPGYKISSGLKLYLGGLFITSDDPLRFVLRPNVYTTVFFGSKQKEMKNGLTTEIGVNYISESNIRDHYSFCLGYVRRF